MLKNILVLIGLSLAAVGCGDSIPEAYRGDFVDASKGASLHIDANGAIYKDMSGRIIEGKQFKLTFADLQKGQPGVYFKDNPNKKDVLELYWLNPDLSTKQDAGGIQWFQAETFYFRMDRKQQGKVNGLETVHSTEGIVSLDVPTSQWQVGWPAQSEMLEFSRTR